MEIKLEHDDILRISPLMKQLSMNIVAVEARLGIENLEDKLNGIKALSDGDLEKLFEYLSLFSIKSQGFDDIFRSHISSEEGYSGLVGEDSGVSFLEYFNKTLKKLGITKAAMARLSNISHNTFFKKSDENYPESFFSSEDKKGITEGIDFMIERLRKLKVVINYNPMIEDLKRREK